MIQGIDVCKNFNGFQALDGANFNIAKGAVYGLVGPNGAGKSTLLRHITGIFKPDSGSILVDGEDVFENVSVKKKMAFIPDDVFYFRQAGIKDMKKFYSGIYDNFNVELYDKVKSCFSELDEKMSIRRMSKGMQKQAAFLLAVSMMPEILVLDEPVDGLDPVMRRQVWNILLNEVSENNMTVIVSSHNLRELEDVCDHVGIMHHGKVILEQSLSELQGNVTKIQLVAGEESPEISEHFEVLNKTSIGRVDTYVIRGNSDEIGNYLASYNPLVMDIVPLTLEEIFIYELGGEDYEVKEILI